LGLAIVAESVFSIGLIGTDGGLVVIHSSVVDIPVKGVADAVKGLGKSSSTAKEVDSDDRLLRMSDGHHVGTNLNTVEFPPLQPLWNAFAT
jgi:hypothetical protein